MLETPIGELAERLDQHRKQRRELHPDLTLTEMYNVLEKVRAEETLNENERTIYNDGAIGVLRELHDELDRLVLQAYGLPEDADEDTILRHLLELNAERKREEENGFIRWLRPEFQAPDAPKHQESMTDVLEESRISTIEVNDKDKSTFPRDRAEQVLAVQDILEAAPAPLSVEQVAAHFKRARRNAVQKILRILVDHGKARRETGDRYMKT